MSVTGIELSRPMIDQLRTKADEATIPLIVGGMASAAARPLVYNTKVERPITATSQPVDRSQVY
jgi:hypothetical protein